MVLKPGAQNVQMGVNSGSYKSSVQSCVLKKVIGVYTLNYSNKRLNNRFVGG